MSKQSFHHALRFSKFFAAALLVITAASCACKDSHAHTRQNNNKNNEVADAGVIQIRQIKKAKAVVHGVNDNKVRGTVTFTKVSGGVKIIADVVGLTPGKHGFHIHEFGDCGKNGEAAGAHFNPMNQKHGGPDSLERHVGDFGNLEADSHGHAHYERVDKFIELDGKNSIIGRSIMIHADEDDFKTQPSGASGARIGCGTIEIENE
ncbi:superoxide dismutase family protein [Candidatus Protochlamydia amoebophila]|nr:superoxide dismutase family protein [Candidatus Protochlamydia amoebophila]